MKLTLKLNLDNFENEDFVTNEYETLEPCYREQIIFLKGWLDYTVYAQPLMDHIIKILGGGGEKSRDIVREAREAVLKDRDEAIYGMVDSKPLPERSYNGSKEVDKHLKKTIVVENKKPLDHNKEDLKLDIFVAYETDKAYLIENDKRLQAWIPKKATVDINVNEFNIGSIVIAHWFKEKIEFKQPEKR